LINFAEIWYSGGDGLMINWQDEQPQVAMHC